ncbi:MAG: VOC family protein [Gemmatimonadales bacterium]
MPETPGPVLGHVGLNVSALSRSTDFYRRAFGLEVLRISEEDGRRYAFLGRDGAVSLTLWQQSSGAFAIDRPGLHHLALRVESIEDVRIIEARLRELGATIHHGGVVPHGEGQQSGGVFFEDPDGIRLEVFAPSGAEVAEAPTAGAPTCGFF